MSRNLLISPQISSKFYVYADCIIGCYVLLKEKLCCCGNKLAIIFERGTLTASA